MSAGYVYMWEYVVKVDRAATFERAYGPGGDWVQLFRRADGYLRTELRRDRSRPTRFVTVDYWRSREAWERFRSESTTEFEALDAKCEELTVSEREIGTFDTVE